MLHLIITLLLALGIISSPSDFYNMSSTEQQNAIEVVIDDIETILEEGS